MTDPICLDCKGTKHIRSNGIWRRCNCVTRELTTNFVKPRIKSRDPGVTHLPWDSEPFPWNDVNVFGTYDNFRLMVWRSLLAYEQRILRYDYMDASRLVEIYLSQDPEYTRVRDLEELDLFILLIGVADLPNKMLPALVFQILTSRFQLARPSWVFTPLKREQFRYAYGTELSDLLNGASDHSPSLPEAPSASARLDPTAI